MGDIAERITALNMIHAYPTHVSAGYAIMEGMLMVKTASDDDDADGDEPGLADR